MGLAFLGGAIGAASGQDGVEGAQKDGKVGAQAGAADIGDVEVDHPVKADLGPAGHLPQAGDAGQDGQPLQGPHGIGRNLGRQGRAGADQRHGALHHIQDLRQLVQRQAAQPAAHRGDAGVVAGLEAEAIPVGLRQQRGAAGLGIQIHRAELQDGTGGAITADPGLHKEHGAGAGQFHQRRHHRENRNKRGQQDQRQHQVERAFPGGGTGRGRQNGGKGERASGRHLAGSLDLRERNHLDLIRIFRLSASG